MSCREQPSFTYISWVQSYWNCSSRSSIITHFCGSGNCNSCSIAIADHGGHYSHSFFADVEEVSQFVACCFCPYAGSYRQNPILLHYITRVKWIAVGCMDPMYKGTMQWATATKVQPVCMCNGAVFFSSFIALMGPRHPSAHCTSLVFCDSR